jgi:DNA gyrase subunit B
MPELVDNGYLYIAQPPLLKVGKGKKEVYLKDETEFKDLILKRFCEDKVLTIGSGEKVSGHRLYLLLGNLSEYYTIMEKMERQGISSNFTELLIKEGLEDKNFLESRDRMLLLRDHLKDEGFDAGEVIWSEERSAYNIEVKLPRELKHITTTSADQVNDAIKLIIGRGLIYSKAYQDLTVIGKKIYKYDVAPFTISEKAKESNTEDVAIQDKKQLLNHVLEESKKGLAVQRYKGLGEMNPDQLWETTMNPAKRNLLQVKVEDVVDTDEIFTILMGEEVEPRREFIQSNALEVSTLDI